MTLNDIERRDAKGLFSGGFANVLLYRLT